ncbi:MULTISPECIES: vanadium-dependent haloperoxidase [unclassified Spirosoma]|uniref:vanadium-dependent haloperoxidase n=1 Tax=unclassified Spirosoma TaxID=2621999 RepID=UPI00095CDEA9|nr:MULTISPECIES: vanadium-dependent haloperoxidase [unclassified Spirosoma]MBN8821341.1 vanadium-dependent haloperoxidase [Spirosoma sp.]OJW78131.1 MAG: phosphatidic acid phosphatase [Spirosoma sp. 48-14]
MKQRLILSLLLGLLACQPSAPPEQYNPKASNPQLFYDCSKTLTDIMIHDVFKPPVASRIYGYTYLAAYEALQPGYREYSSLMGKLNGSKASPKPDSSVAYCYPVASFKAFITVGRALTFSADLWDAFEKTFWPRLEALQIPDDVYDRSVQYGELIAKHVLEYASKDHYKETRGFRYTVTNEPGTWVPTPPAYADACEPQWNTVRVFTLDSARQFRCPPPAKYDLNRNSPFWKLTEEVYTIGKRQDKTEQAIAYFWDDNAFVTNISGHVMFASKKMSPVGHWLAIATTLARQQKLTMIQATQLFALTSIAMFDAFIACWDEKYTYARIRPETVINNTIDPQWRPFLETPAFPEYVSGHSDISAAAGKVIGQLIGNNVAFTDSTELPYGHGVRSFTSVEAAYQEASISRVYGGIHYRDGVEEGTVQGEHVGQHVLQKLLPQLGIAKR